MMESCDQINSQMISKKRQLTQQEQVEMIQNEMRNIQARVIGFNEALANAWLGMKQALSKRGYPAHAFDRFWKEHRAKFMCTFTDEQIREFASDVNNKLSNGAKDARDAKRQRDCNRGSIHANGLFLEMLRLIIDIYQRVRHSDYFPDRERVGKIVKFGLLAYVCEKEYRNMNESGELTGITGRVFPKTALRLGFRQEIKKHWMELIVKSDSRQTTQRWQDQCGKIYQDLVRSFQPDLADASDQMMGDVDMPPNLPPPTSLPSAQLQLLRDNSFDSMGGHSSNFSSSAHHPAFNMTRSMTQSLTSSSKSFASSATSAGLPEQLAGIEISFDHDIADFGGMDMGCVNNPPHIPPPIISDQKKHLYSDMDMDQSGLPLPPMMSSNGMVSQTEMEAAGKSMDTLLDQFHRMKEYFCKMQNQMSRNRKEWQQEVVGLRNQVSDLSAKVMELEIENQSLRQLTMSDPNDFMAPTGPASVPNPTNDRFMPRKRRRVDEHSMNLDLMSPDDCPPTLSFVDFGGSGGGGSSNGNGRGGPSNVDGFGEPQPQQRYMFAANQSRPQQQQQGFGGASGYGGHRQSSSSSSSRSMSFRMQNYGGNGGASSNSRRHQQRGHDSNWGYGGSYQSNGMPDMPLLDSPSFVDM